MRILLSSVGRRGYLVRFFKQASGPHDEIWGGDCSQYVSAFNDCDNAILLPLVTAPDYVDELLDLCRRCGIDMLVPLIDPELEVLAGERTRFADAGTLVVVSPPKTIEIAFDKYRTYQFGLEHGIPVPHTLLTLEEARQALTEGALTWPVVVKPRRGSASVNITFCHNSLEMEAAFESCPRPMIQEFLQGDEYGYDLFCDQAFRPISVYCKKKIQMRAGETDKAISVNDPVMLALGNKITDVLDIFGPLDADVICTSDGPKLLEINPRFGGGYPCSHLCGADFPAKLIALRAGKTLKPDTGPPPAGVYMFKQDEIISSSPETIEQRRDFRHAAVTKPLNVLFTSAGRRVSLLRAFRRAANDLGVRFNLHAVDCRAMAPALAVANESAVVPPAFSDKYVEELLAYCGQHQIDALVPLIDTELLVLSEARDRFAEAGVRLILSSSEVIRTSIDKVRTAAFLESHGFRTPHILSEEELANPAFPLFMKPHDGSSSVQARQINSAYELVFNRRLTPLCIVQEFIPGDEYTVDVFADFDGRPLCAVPRRRHEVRGGEVSKGQAIAHRGIMEQSRRLVEALGECMGMITIQCFLTRQGEVVFIEINPRFGGGVPLSIAAGADSPRWLIELLLGRKPSVSLNGWTNQLLMLRYDDAFFLMPSDLAR